MSFDVQILVNGHKCKQYQHCGKTYIEAKNGSEYVLEIKNNHWKRILAVSSIDGLNVLTGKSANENDTGYIVNSYSTEKIKGFRISDSEWALFKFGYKFNGNTYAQSKNDGSEKNCGVIGLRFYYEKEPIVINTWSTTPWTDWPYGPAYSAGGLYGSGRYGYNIDVNYSCDSLGQQMFSLGNCSNNSATIQNASMNLSSTPSKLSRGASKGGCSGDVSVNYCSTPQLNPTPTFDMGTEFGRKEHSKVQNVSFDRGCLAQSLDIYYASREALIEMGVPIHNTLSTNLPQSFPGQYCEPPKGWNG